jgi:hypothetical protein
MNLVKKDYSSEPASAIRQAIIDKEAMSSLSVNELTEKLYNAVSVLSPSDVRGFIYRCMTNRDLAKGFVMADKAIDFALSMKASGKTETGSELIGAAVGTLSILSGSNPMLKDKIAELLKHKDSEVVIAVIDNLGHTSNLDNFHKVADLLTHSDFDIARAAAKYIEECARDAAFRKRQDLYVIEDASEEFLRKALLRLESAYKQLKYSKNAFVEVFNRIAILVAMMYNEILDSMDWKRAKQEEVDERIYYALEQYLHDQVGGEALPYIEESLLSPNVEGGIKRSSLHTLSRLGKQERFKDRIRHFLSELKIAKSGSSDDLSILADSIAKALAEGKEFSIVSYVPDAAGRLSSIVPRAAGAPLKRPEPTNLDEL